MKRASYRHGVAIIALNDEAGGDEALDESIVRTYISVGLLADLFDVPVERVARDVVRYRKKNPDV